MKLTNHWIHGWWSFRRDAFLNVDVYGNQCQRAFPRPVCGRYRGVLFGLKGDRKFLQKALKLSTSWASDKCCMYCAATLSGLLVYTSCGQHAPHRAHIQSTLGFISNGSSPNPWSRLPGFSISMALTDWLHLVDLAITPEASASVAKICLSIFPMALLFSTKIHLNSLCVIQVFFPAGFCCSL